MPLLLAACAAPPKPPAEAVAVQPAAAAAAAAAGAARRSRADGAGHAAGADLHAAHAGPGGRPARVRRQGAPAAAARARQRDYAPGRAGRAARWRRCSWRWLLAQTRAPADLARALGLLQRVIANPATEAQALHPLARLLAARYQEQRRVEDDRDRQAQQLRDSQRRIDQLNDRHRGAAGHRAQLLASQQPAARRAGGTQACTMNTRALRIREGPRPAPACWWSTTTPTCCGCCRCGSRRPATRSRP